MLTDLQDAVWVVYRGDSVKVRDDLATTNGDSGNEKPNYFDGNEPHCDINDSVFGTKSDTEMPCDRISLARAGPITQIGFLRVKPQACLMSVNRALLLLWDHCICHHVRQLFTSSLLYYSAMITVWQIVAVSVRYWSSFNSGRRIRVRVCWTVRLQLSLIWILIDYVLRVASGFKLICI